MLVVDTETEMGQTLRETAALEAALLDLGTTDEIEAVAQAIADSARRLMDAVLVTITVPSPGGSGALVIGSPHGLVSLVSCCQGALPQQVELRPPVHLPL